MPLNFRRTAASFKSNTRRKRSKIAGISLSIDSHFIFNKNILINQINRTAIALRGKDGIVLAVEKLVTSKLYEVGANKRIFTVDRHIGVAVAGLLADARAIVENAREEAKNYRSEYGSPIPIKVLLLRV